jgi:Tol biopolymer transport system component
MPGTNAPEILVWVDRNSIVQPVDPAWTGDLEFEALALSPDGSRVAVEIVGGSANTLRLGSGLSRGDIWIKQLPRGPLSRLTFGSLDNRTPTWSPDGKTLAYLSRGENDVWSVMRRPADGSGVPEALPMPPRELHEISWSADGQWLVGSMAGPPSDDIVALRIGTDTAWSVIVQGPADEFEPMLSPDGRWLAYASDESGQAEVYVRPFPNTSSGKWQISPEGGIEPIWSANGRKLYYRSFDGNAVWSASLAGEPSAAERQVVLRIPEGAYEANPRNRLMAVTADGQRFLMINQTGLGDVSGDMVFVQNILAELRSKAGR